MKAHEAILTAALSAALISRAGAARAQNAGESQSSSQVTAPAPPSSGEASAGERGATTSAAQTSAAQTAQTTSAFGPVVGPSVAQGEPERYARTPDPTGWQYFAMPGARTLAQGDGAVSVGSLLGWVALRYGAHRRVDVGVGVPYALVGVSADVRIALVSERSWALSAWVMAQVPVHPGTSVAGDFFGFTWGGGGAWGAVGPLVSIFGDRGGVHFGAHVAQRVSMGGLWGLAHLSADVRVADGVKILGQALVFGEMVNESSATVGRRALIGNQQPRVMPYGTLGVRLFNRRSSVDVGALVIVGERSLLAYGSVSVWPWLSAVHAF
ncbi:MAG: hypothetical protein U0269_08915 [Polyangiales bacterium]